MDIKIEAPKHANQQSLQEFYSEKLNKKYGVYPFIKSIDAKVIRTNNGTYEVSLQLKPEKGTMQFASGSNNNEHTAFNAAIKKMNHIVEKYKEKRYNSTHRSHKKYIISEEEE